MTKLLLFKRNFDMVLLVKNLLSIKLLSKKQLAKDTWQFVFTKPKTFSFLPGQYTTIYLGKDSRDFTIASSPLEKDFFIITRKGVSEFKKNLLALAIGSTLVIKRPAGGFVLQEKDLTQKVFLAGGIGITPFYSMIMYAHKKKLKIPMTLFVSFSKKEDIIFYEELQQIEKENPLVKIIYTLSQDAWDKEVGRVSEQLVRKYVGNHKTLEYMIAGGEEMVENTEKLLLTMGVKSEKIRIDIFTGY